MKRLFQVISMLVIIPATYMLLYWIPLPLFSVSHARGILMAIALVGACGVGWMAWRKIGTAPDDLLESMGKGAVTLGVLGFCGGFFGPLVFTPDANQGPLLGIFITGPLGFIFGAIAGAVRWKLSTTNRVR